MNKEGDRIEFVLPDPFAPLIQFLNSIANAFQQQQDRLKQEFMHHAEQIKNEIEDIVEGHELIRKLERYSEINQKEVSGIIFIDPQTREVEKVYLDRIGDATSVDLDMVRISPDPDLLVYSFHTHPVWGNPAFSDEDMDVIKNRSWEQGHCVLTEVNGQFIANCVEI